MDKYEYISVIAVKKSKETQNASDKFCICYVPRGASLDSGDLVLYGYPDTVAQHKGVCVSNTLFLDRETLDMVCRVMSTTPQMMPLIAGKITVNWYTNKEAANE